MANEKKAPPRNQEATQRMKEEQARRGRRRTRQLLGLVLTVLIVVGAISIVQSGIELWRTMADDTAELEEYNQRLGPLVWFDPLPFESLAEADEVALKQGVIWGVLNQMGNNNVERDDMGQALVPVIEVDRYAAALFGPDFHLNHESFEDAYQGLEYNYDAEAGLYTVPSTSLMPDYLISVVEVTRINSSVRRVTAGYVSTRGNNDELIATPDMDNPAKYMDYFFRRDGNAYYLYALRSNTSYTPPEKAATSQEVISGVSGAVENEELLMSSSSLPQSMMQPAMGTTESGSGSSQEDASASGSESGSEAESESESGSQSGSSKASSRSTSKN